VTDAAAPWVSSLDPRARQRLLCLPFAGGGTAPFRALREALPGTVDLCPVALPGRERRLSEPAHDDMDSLVEALVSGLLPAIRRVPYALYGHSMGAWVAFELVRALRRLRRPLPTHLFVAARRAPHLPSERPPLSHLPRQAFIDGVQERYDAIPEALLTQPGILDLFLPTLRADFQLLDAYRYRDGAPLPVPITALVGTGDAVVSARDVRAWREHTEAAFSFVRIDGGHFFLADHADEVGELLGQRMSR